MFWTFTGRGSYERWRFVTFKLTCWKHRSTWWFIGSLLVTWWMEVVCFTWAGIRLFVRLHDVFMKITVHVSLSKTFKVFHSVFSHENVMKERKKESYESSMKRNGGKEKFLVEFADQIHSRRLWVEMWIKMSLNFLTLLWKKISNFYQTDFEASDSHSFTTSWAETLDPFLSSTDRMLSSTGQKTLQEEAALFWISDVWCFTCFVVTMCFNN